MFAVTRKLRVLKPVFTEQRRKKGDLTLNVQLAKGFLYEAQQLVSSDRQNEAFLQLEHCCRLVYAKAAKVEQIMLQQRAKMQWMKGRRVARTILQINDDNGTIHTEPEEIINEFVCYYQNLLGGNRRQTTLDIGFLRPWARHILPNEKAGHLILAFTQDDVKQAVFDITEDKAPGPDGYSSGFFKAAWPVVGQEVTKAVLEFFSTGKLLKQVNSTLSALIPKVHTPMTVGDFRPISCCNVLYKIIAKLLVQRLSVVLDKIISPCQGAFIPGRSIGDNILLAQELLAGYNKVRLPPCCNQVSQLGADVDSVRVFKMGLDRFAEWSGLRLNIQKSHLILSRSAQDRREQMVVVLGFQEGHLPMRYLGLPLLSSRLSISDCQPLLSKIDARITGWEGISLSYAGRVQIIKSVLSSLSLYWASAFILPKAVVKEVEKRLRTFLWKRLMRDIAVLYFSLYFNENYTYPPKKKKKGTSMTGYAKVAWKDICKPVEEGGLGIKDIGVLNHALMTKKLCDVIRCGLSGCSTDDYGITPYVGEQGGSWGWRKMLRLRSSIQPMVELHIGDGRSFYLWKDPWHQLGPLLPRFPRGPNLLGLEDSTKLSSVIDGGQWHWPLITDLECLQITYTLPQIHGGDDMIIWRFPDGQPTTQALYRLFCPPGPKEKLPTTDRPWLTHLGGCILCNEEAVETHSHLFFRCRFSRLCLAAVRRIIRVPWPNREWGRDVEWATRKWRGKHIINTAYRALLGTLVYHIWRERNLRRFQQIEHPANVLASFIVDDVRQTIMILQLFGFPQTFTRWIEECVTTAAFSIGLNGNPHGFFTGARGLRQGDPLSPYLFVLVMEVLHLGLLQLIEQDLQFSYHWKCEPAKVFQLGFADDLLLFCRADLNSLRILKRGLDQFAEWSGLRLSVQKSHVIISRSAQGWKDQILTIMGFQEGQLPVRYLGLPLLSSRLFISDCQPLLLKIDARINGWEGISLSYAGRIQIIKSVLSAMSIYWASAFILLKAIIKQIEKCLRTFLWKGTSTSGYAKVAWKDVCEPIKEGGQGIKDIGILNRSLIAKKLCDVIRCDRTSIWVEWLKQTRLHNTSIWTINEKGGSWGWRKLLRLRSSILPMMEFLIGEGRSFYLWKDPWHQLGPLIARFPRGSSLLGLDESAKLQVVINEGQWQWPFITDLECMEIIYMLPLIHGGDDRIKWRFPEGRPTTQSLYRLFCPPGPKVGWSSLLSGSLKIPRHNFILWLAIQEKLPTIDKPWMTHLGGCILYDEGTTETHTHMFFRCRFSRGCLAAIRQHIRFAWPNREWTRDVEWASRKWRGKH
ncbi:UNVERIFIED_CONTAM: putative mitochondrial protein [Sesamum indicum]